jgi:hypothetical protein
MPLEGLADDAGVGWNGMGIWWRRRLFKSWCVWWMECPLESPLEVF